MEKPDCTDALPDLLAGQLAAFRQWFAAMPLLIVMAWLFAGTATAATSPLDVWNLRATPIEFSSVTLKGVTHGNSQFVVVGNSGKILTSPDGVTWTPQNSGITKTLYSVVHGNGLFVAAGASGNILSSPDGVTWTPQTSGGNAHLYSVRFLNGQFVAVSGSGTTLTSPNGANWTPHPVASTNYWSDVAFGDGKYVNVGYEYYTGNSRAGVTTDHNGWNIVATGYERYLDAVIYAEGKFIAVGYAGVQQRSTDGVTWSPHASASTSKWLFCLAHGEGEFVAAGESGALVSSPDGEQWTHRQPGTTRTFNGVAFGKGTFVVVGEKGTIYQSDPLVGGAPAPAVTISQMTKNGTQVSFVFNGQAGQNYQVETSENLTTWGNVGNVTCNATPMPFTHDAGSDAMKFYRVVKP